MHGVQTLEILTKSINVIYLTSVPAAFPAIGYCESKILDRSAETLELPQVFSLKLWLCQNIEKYKVVENNIKRCTKKVQENWIGEQFSETEENLRKNNSKKAYQMVKDLTTVKQGKASTVQDSSGKCFTEERQILNRWTEYCSEL